MSAQNTTVRLLAQLCGVSKSTVGMALHNDPRVAEKTRMRIKRMAEERGYKGDPRVRHLMSLLKRGRREAVWNIAWLNSSNSENAWTSLPWLSGYLKGIRRRASELGYDIDPIWIKDQTPEQLARVLKARGIQGLLVPFPEKADFWALFPWQQFSAVVVDEFDVKLSLPHVVSDRHGNMQTLLSELEQAGYRRPALWLQERVDEARDVYSSAFLGWHQKRGRDNPLLLPFDKADSRDLGAKVKAHRPDVIVCCHNGAVKCLEEAGFSVPEDIGVVHLNLAGDVPDWSGIDQRHECVGATVLDVLNALLIGGETGVPPHPHTVSIPGVWRQGNTTVDSKNMPREQWHCPHAKQSNRRHTIDSAH